MMVVGFGRGWNGTVLGRQCANISLSEMMAVLVWVLSVDVVLCALSYRALNGARPTLPKRCVVVKEHCPANLRACSGDIESVRR